jgi:Big-like domain-containing protein
VLPLPPWARPSMAAKRKTNLSMIQRIVFISAALLLGLLGDFRGAAAQSCVVQAARYNLSADSVDWSIKITSGRSCVGGVRFGNVEIEGVKLVSRPQFGQVALEGPGFRYTSKPNYSGPDSFSLAVVGRINKVRGNSTIHVTVAVGDSSASSNPTSRTPSKDITPPSKDIIPPSVAFITPSEGSTVSGFVTLTATASDNVANVQYRVDGIAIGSAVTASPYTTTWDSAGVVDGSHLLWAVAQDTSRHFFTSYINIVVKNIGP